MLTQKRDTFFKADSREHLDKAHFYALPEHMYAHVMLSGHRDFPMPDEMYRIIKTA